MDHRARRVSPGRSLPATLDGILAVACGSVGADGGAIYLREPEHGDFALAASRGLPGSAAGHRVAPGDGLLGLVLATGRTQTSIDVTIDPRARHVRPDWSDAPPVRAFLGVPLRTGDLVIGALELTGRRVDAFTPDDRTHALILADAAALLIEQSLLATQPPPAALEGGGFSGDDPMGMLMVSPRLRVTGANPTLCRMLGEPVEALVGRSALAVLPVLGRPRARDALEAALRGSATHLGMARTVDRAGGEQDLSLTLIPLGDPSRGVAGIVVIVLDVTERARLEAELREQNVRAIEARDRLRTVVEVVSHELRTPLTSVLGYARLLEDRLDAPTERRAHWAGLVAVKARMMARLVDEVTDLARLGSARFSLRRAPVDLGALAASVAADLAGLSERHVFDVEVAPGLPVVQADPDRVAQVLSNLLTNAVKFWPDGGTVEVRAATDPARQVVEVSVADGGPGVPPEQAERIFEPFHRGRHPSGPAASGSGLGLAVSRGIVEAHGGRIWVEPGPAGGAVFRFTLPVAPPREPGAAA